MGKINVGDKLPEFSLPNQHGKTIHASSFLGRKLVLFFYPKDYTSTCTAEVCSFRDSYDIFKKKGAEVVGVSSDDVASHKGFATQHALTYDLLSDVDGKVRKLMGVPKFWAIVPGRVTYIINENGEIMYIFNSLFDSKRHVEEALKII